MVCILCTVPFLAIIGVAVMGGGGFYKWLLWLGIFFVIISFSVYAYYYFGKKTCKDPNKCLLPGIDSKGDTDIKIISDKKVITDIK